QEERNLALRPEVAADLESAPAGQHHVDEHEVVGPLPRLPQALVAVKSEIHGKAAGFEVVPLELGDAPVILDDEQALHGDGSRGRLITRHAPAPGGLSARISPPWASTIRRAIVRPRPLPSVLR